MNLNNILNFSVIFCMIALTVNRFGQILKTSPAIRKINTYFYKKTKKSHQGETFCI